MRFPEFSGEWKKEFLGTTCNVLMCKRILASQTNAECGVPFYKIGTIGGAPDAYISKELFESYRAKYNYPRKGEVMITCAGTVGKAMIFDGEDSYYQDSNIVWIDNPTNKIDNTFLYHLISKVDWSKLNTTTIVRIYNDDLRQLRISYPTLSEQRKISIFFNLLNQRIETQKKIIEDLKKLKYAINKRVFENHGSSDSMLLGRVADIYQPQTIPTSWLNNTLQYPVYGANGVIGKYSEYNHENSQICIACRGNTCGTVNYSEPKSWITGNAMVINTDRYDINKRFLFHQLCTVNYNPLISGSGQPQIVRRPLEKMKIWFPNKDVQERIATLFDTLENRILIEETALGLIEKTKQYLLLQMFI